MAEEPLETLVRRLTAMMYLQHEHNERYDALIAQQSEFNRQQVAINQDVRTTLARVETLLARLIPQGENGRDA